jgi:recombination endonuclease VII
VIRRSCARCACQLSKPRHQARKKHCYRCEIVVKREQQERSHDAYVSRTYGIPLGSYRLLYEAQGGVCYICRRSKGTTKRLAVDHDHRTGRVRGLICKPCNWLLGHSRDDPEMFTRAREYLLNPPARSVIYGERAPALDSPHGEIQAEAA